MSSVAVAGLFVVDETLLCLGLGVHHGVVLADQLLPGRACAEPLSELAWVLSQRVICDVAQLHRDLLVGL